MCFLRLSLFEPFGGYWCDSCSLANSLIRQRPLKLAHLHESLENVDHSSYFYHSFWGPFTLRSPLVYVPRNHPLIHRRLSPVLLCQHVHTKQGVKSLLHWEGCWSPLLRSHTLSLVDLSSSVISRTSWRPVLTEGIPRGWSHQGKIREGGIWLL